MQLKLIDDLPYAEVIIVYQGKKIEVDHVLVNTGSASTIYYPRCMGPRLTG